MHEMGIAGSVLEAVNQELHRYPAHRAAKVVLRIGEFAGVDRESLQFCFEALVKGSELEPLDLEIEWCRLEGGRRGDELELAYLELEDSPKKGTDLSVPTHKASVPGRSPAVDRAVCPLFQE